MEYFPILEMPEEIQALVVERVAGNSFQDLYGLRVSCKLMKALADRRSVCHFYVVLSVPWGLNMPAKLLKTCYSERNPRTLYIKGVQIGKLVRSVKWGWGLWHGDAFPAKRAEFISAVVPSFCSCQCAPLLRRECPCLWHIDTTKDDNMCDHCFWINEVGLFFRDFEPISLIRNTIKCYINVTLMDYFPILELPEEIQALVVERVAGNSFTDLYGLRASCKSMKALAERSRVNHFYDVLSVPRRLNAPPELLKTCYAERNPSTLYMKGVHFFFTFNLQEEGLAFMKLAADEGYERAVIGKLVRSLKWAWGLSHGDEFWAKRDEFISTVVPSFYSCQCVPVLEQDWVLWYIENSKGDKMCNRCFWIKELGLFFREFEPMSVIRDTREW
ncbi:hypothetical protein F2Q68_00024485 [Brassica cretica]|uniref:F-box domain-containing protein n=1 Tax=Brassica cretica TaxID=69181 RepID=A0A8S9IHR1_BRACR|nr:hypothetical protein F2Q68_00024485 [Brassica cretica]